MASPPELHVNGQNPGAQFQANFSAASNAGEKRLTYWLTGDEDLVARIELALGPDSGYPSPSNVLAALFIDGKLVRGDVDGVDTGAKVSTLTVGSTVSFTLTVNHASISDGAHSAAFLCWGSDGKDWGGGAFTVLKNSFVFGPFVDVGKAPADSRGFGVYDRGTGRLLYGEYAPPVTATFEAVVGPLVQECPDTPVNIAVVGVIDDAQVEPSGQDFLTTTTTPSAMKSVSFDVSGIPSGDGKVHHMLFWELRGFGQYAEAPTGVRAPWSGTPVRIGVGVWGP